MTLASAVQLLRERLACISDTVFAAPHDVLSADKLARFLAQGAELSDEEAAGMMFGD